MCWNEVDTGLSFWRSTTRLITCAVNNQNSNPDHRSYQTTLVKASHHCVFVRWVSLNYDGQHFCLPLVVVSDTDHTNLVRCHATQLEVYPLAKGFECYTCCQGYYSKVFWCFQRWIGYIKGFTMKQCVNSETKLTF